MPDGTFVLLKDVCGTSKSGIIKSIFILLSPSWQRGANHDACPEQLSWLTRPKKACNLESILFCFNSSAKKKTHYVFCLQALRNCSQTFSVCSQSGPSVTAVHKWRKCKWSKIKQNCFTTPAPYIPKWIGLSGKMSALPAGYFINVVKVIFCFIAVRSLHSLNYLSNECLVHQFWSSSTNCNISLLARSFEHPLKQKPTHQRGTTSGRKPVQKPNPSRWLLYM